MLSKSEALEKAGNQTLNVLYFCILLRVIGFIWYGAVRENEFLYGVSVCGVEGKRITLSRNKKQCVGEKQPKFVERIKRF